MFTHPSKLKILTSPEKDGVNHREYLLPVYKGQSVVVSKIAMRAVFDLVFPDVDFVWPLVNEECGCVYTALERLGEDVRKGLTGVRGLKPHSIDQIILWEEDYSNSLQAWRIDSKQDYKSSIIERNLEDLRREHHAIKAQVSELIAEKKTMLDDIKEVCKSNRSLSKQLKDSQDEVQIFSEMEGVGEKYLELVIKISDKFGGMSPVEVGTRARGIWAAALRRLPIK